jgi:hypothetical protein
VALHTTCFGCATHNMTEAANRHGVSVRGLALLLGYGIKLKECVQLQKLKSNAQRPGVSVQKNNFNSKIGF